MHKTQKELIRKILNTSLDDINKQIKKIEQQVKKDIQELESIASQKDIFITVDESYETAKKLAKEIGFSNKKTYQTDFNSYTAQINSKRNLYYTLRKQDSDFYPIKNIKFLKDNQIKASHNCYFPYYEKIHKYQNGNTIYQLNQEQIDDLKDTIDLYNEIENLME